MPRDLRYLPRPGALVEITQRTIQGRYLLRPSRRLRQIVVGCLARAQSTTAARLASSDPRSAVRLHAIAVLSNHFHLLASFETTEHMTRFMNHFKTNLSKEVGRLHDWPGSLYAGRYQSVWVSEEPAAQEARLRYILSQGVKEGLVLSPRDWPGLHCAEALLTGEPLHGVWVERARLFAARQKDAAVKESEFTCAETLRLAPLPAWTHLSEAKQRSRVAKLVDSIEAEAKACHEAAGTAPLGATAICRRHPHDRPATPSRSPKPRVHAATRAVRRLLVGAYRLFEVAYRESSARLAAGDRSVRFPENCFPPRLPFVAPLAA